MLLNSVGIQAHTCIQYNNIIYANFNIILTDNITASFKHNYYLIDSTSLLLHCHDVSIR